MVKFLSRLSESIINVIPPSFFEKNLKKPLYPLKVPVLLASVLMAEVVKVDSPNIVNLSIKSPSKVELSLDLKPALSNEQVDARLLRDFDSNKNKDLLNVIKGLMPNALVKFFAAKCHVDLDKKVHDVTKEERKRMVECLKNLPLKYNGLYPLETGIITSGGVNLKEVNPKTFESKLVEGLYFVGEVLDVDALTGGFNLQIAFATAYCCAKNF